MKAPPVLRLSPFGAADRSDPGGRNSCHVAYIATHKALQGPADNGDPNAAHVVYQATHGALADSEGRRLIGNAAGAGERAAAAEARAHAGHQWRWIVSLRGEDADALGYHTDEWHRLAHELAPRLAAAIGVRPADLRWVAAHHDPQPAPGQPRHPHLHIAIWSATPLRRPHRLSRDELRQARRAVTQAIYGPERTRLAQQKQALREAIRQSGAQTLGEALQVARSLRGRMQLPASEMQVLGRRLVALAAMMPGHGRAALAYLPAAVKQEARDIADWVITREDLVAHLDEYRTTARELAGLYVHDPVKLAAAELRAVEDLRDRVAQAVARAGAQLNRDDARTIRMGRGGAGRAPAVHLATRDLLKAVSQALQQEPGRRGRGREEPRGRDGRGDDGRGRDF